jgi:riboflavin kinase/FMN adenylyltransferase
VSVPSFIVANDPPEPPAGLAGAVAAIGNFDGLHRGHRGVIARARELAGKLGRPCVSLTFEPKQALITASRPSISIVMILSEGISAPSRVWLAVPTNLAS